MGLPLDLEKTIVPWLGKTAKLIHLFMTDKFGEYQLDLTTKQWLVLAKLKANNGIIQNDLALITDRDKASLTRLLKTLENKDLVSRISNPLDKRINHVHLTSKGHEVFDKSAPVIKEAFHEIQNNLTSKDINTIIDVMQRVQNNMSVARKSCS